jgi:2-oxo-4-hydroxy-4-carboxy-5-ureidoimidazoline decarboxylase
MFSLQCVNEMSEEDFLSSMSVCYNGSSTKAPAFATFALQQAFLAKPFASRDALFRALTAPLIFGERDAVVALLRDREPLGNKRPEASEHLPEWEKRSNAEHASVGLHRLAQDEFDLMADLNRRYRDKHGFTFIIRAAGRSKPEIIERLTTRLANATEDEVAIAVRQYSEIIGLRLKDIVKNGDELEAR